MPSAGQNGLSRLVSLTSREAIPTSASLSGGIRNAAGAAGAAPFLRAPARGRFGSFVVIGAPLADEVHRDVAPMRLQPVLPDVDALPRAEREPPLGDGDRQLHGGQGRAHV